MFKGNMPKKVIWPSNGNKSKLQHLRLGFYQLGIPVAVSDELGERSSESDYYVIHLDYGGAKPVEVIFDIAADRFITYEHMMTKDNFYFKTHASRHNVRKYPNMFPFPQSVSNMSYMVRFMDMRRRRMTAKKDFPIDLVGIFVNTDNGLRQKVVEKTRNIKKWDSRIWMIKHPRLERDPIPEGLIGPKLRYSNHLETQARSKACFALPGARKNKEASISFRHVELWGIGGVVIGLKPKTVLVGNPGQIWVEIKKDLSDFEEVIDGIIGDPKRRRKLAAAGIKYFDSTLNPESHAKYMLRMIQRNS